MKILSAAQIRELDAYTIRTEPVPSVDLMERAAKAFVQWLLCKFDEAHEYAIFCGKGNNGGDGLAVARMLIGRGNSVKVFIVEHRESGTPDFEENLRRLEGLTEPVFVRSAAGFSLPATGIVIDALLGTGLISPARGLLADVIPAINDSGLTVVSVDIASGLFTDKANESEDVIVKPDYTVSFQVPKLAFFIPDCYPYVGEWHIADIGLDREFLEKQPSDYFLTTRENLPHLKKKRGKYSHKGTYGHALMIAGSYGKMGAAVLSSRACLRSGVGLLTAYVPGCGYEIMQIAVPEAMVMTDPGRRFLVSMPESLIYSAIGAGPGIGTEQGTLEAFKNLLERFPGPMVLDADALNLLALHPELLELLPENAVLTPHPKEFQRLAGASGDGFGMVGKARDFARQHKVIVCLKGAHTAVVLPDGKVYFNSTGNPGMATGGSGDVLTGMILALLAQGYTPDVAARLAVYRHGEAGDRQAAERTEEALIASDLIEGLRW
ncbi:MAG: bifunctional ADP-dependent (S)-NAD(P)H-hydrate dehydratase/NAD(P)H-hydrate epimerase [Cytophagaceae bacterium SCN 52-12]|nr:MAG: bifunctional ADP-dependent (S)-NAD(P)H-hydrate dehydratase/NAD(P)H-hydrate epimerase [Cytophagaceae bacterium SCN 52-12]